MGGPLNAVVQMQFWAWEFTSDWAAWGQGSEEGGRMTFACYVLMLLPKHLLLALLESADYC